MNLKKIKDTRNSLLKKLLMFLTDSAKVQDSAMCDDIIIAQKTASLSDEDVIKQWDEYANSKSEAKVYQTNFQEFLSEELDVAESLDDLTYDYCVNTGIDFASAVGLLNNFLSVNDKVMFCDKLIKCAE